MEEKTVWSFKFSVKGFRYYLYIRGDEEDAKQLLKDRVGFAPEGYRLKPEEVELVKKLGINIYHTEEVI